MAILLKPSSCRAVMFDLDGTLADSLADIAAAANHALSQLGRPTYPVQEYRYKVGQGLESLMQVGLGPEHASLIPRGIELFKEYYAVHSIDQTGPYPGIASLLDELTRRGVMLAVLSNKPHPATLQIMDKIFSNWKFAYALGHRPGTALKPDPASAIEIVNASGIPREQWLYVGDTKVDMLTAVNAGLYPVGVLWGFREREELEQSGAQTIIREPAELLNLLK